MQGDVGGEDVIQTTAATGTDGDQISKQQIALRPGVQALAERLEAALITSHGMAWHCIALASPAACQDLYRASPPTSSLLLTPANKR